VFLENRFSASLNQEFLDGNLGEELVDVGNQNGSPLFAGGGNADTCDFRQVLIDQIQNHGIWGGINSIRNGG